MAHDVTGPGWAILPAWTRRAALRRRGARRLGPCQRPAARRVRLSIGLAPIGHRRHAGGPCGQRGNHDALRARAAWCEVSVARAFGMMHDGRVDDGAAGCQE